MALGPEDGIVDADRMNELAARIRQLPPVAASDVRRTLQSAHANLAFRHGKAATDDQTRQKRLELAASLFGQAGDTDGRLTVERELALIARRRARHIEWDATQSKALLEQARRLEQAAIAYGSRWQDDARRCRERAVESRRAAEVQAMAAPGIGRMLDETNRVAEEAAELRPSRTWRALDDIPHDLIVVQGTTGFGPSQEHDEFVTIFARHFGIDLSDPRVRGLLWRLLMEAGDTSRFCPTPRAMPIWVVTTTWHKTVLALLGAALAGDGAAAAGGMDARAVVVGILGAECGVVTSLISTYLTNSPDDHVAILLQERDPPECAIILCLAQGSKTYAELAQESCYPIKTVREIVKRLRDADVVAAETKKGGGSRKWKLIIPE
jgi:hypothetical protein